MSKPFKPQKRRRRRQRRQKSRSGGNRTRQDLYSRPSGSLPFPTHYVCDLMTVGRFSVTPAATSVTHTLRLNSANDPMGSLTGSPQSPYFDILGTIYQRIRVDQASVSMRIVAASAAPVAVCAYPSRNTSSSLDYVSAAAQPFATQRLMTLSGVNQPLLFPRGGGFFSLHRIVDDLSYFGSVNYTGDFTDNPLSSVNLFVAFESIDGSTNLDCDMIVTVRQRVMCWGLVAVADA